VRRGAVDSEVVHRKKLGHDKVRVDLPTSLPEPDHLIDSAVAGDAGVDHLDLPLRVSGSQESPEVNCVRPMVEHP
jgi:hypothetical protein